MFVHYNNKIVNTDIISEITYDDYVIDNMIHVFYKNKSNSDGVVYLDGNGSNFECVKGMEATNLIMALCPSALEGQQAKYHRHAWAIHNLIGHPLMQIFSWLHLTKVGMWIHDHTVPEPLSIE